MCVCHIEGEWCFYCDMYSPLEDEVSRLRDENYALTLSLGYASEWEQEADRLREENERIWHIVEEMRMTWKPADHCDSCAHLKMELSQHKTVRKHYLAENDRLTAAIESIKYTCGELAKSYRSFAEEAADKGSMLAHLYSGKEIAYEDAVNIIKSEVSADDTQENNGR